MVKTIGNGLTNTFPVSKECYMEYRDASDKTAFCTCCEGQSKRAECAGSTAYEVL